MKRILCAQLPEPHRPAALSEVEAHHAVKVLRLRDGEEVEALDGKGHSVVALLRTRGGLPRLEFSSASAETLKIEKTEEVLANVILELAVLKGDAMEWAIEKSVELGVRKLIPVLTAHTVVQIDKKGPAAFQERWQKIADQALKQCGRLGRLEIALPVELNALLANEKASAQAPRLWCHEQGRDNERELAEMLLNHSDQPRPPDPAGWSGVRILVGPEGGWSTAEMDLLARSRGDWVYPVSLGPLVLRAETAALAAANLAVSILRFNKRQLDKKTPK